MPRQATIAILQDSSTEAPEATDAEILETLQDTVTIPTAIEEAGTDTSDSDKLGSNTSDISPELSNIQLDCQGLMDGPMLCEVVSLMRGDKAQEKYLRAERVAALRA